MVIPTQIQCPMSYISKATQMLFLEDEVINQEILWYLVEVSIKEISARYNRIQYVPISLFQIRRGCGLWINNFTVEGFVMKIFIS